MRLRIVLHVDVELPVWQAEYGLRGDQVVDDIEAHVPTLIDDAIEQKARQLGGTFQLHSFPQVTDRFVSDPELQWVEATGRWEARVTGPAR